MCGDGIVDPGEVCDDAGANGKPGNCAADCSGLTAYCGDGNIHPGETCDDGNSVNGDECSCGEYGVVWSWLDDDVSLVRNLGIAEDGSVLAALDGSPFEPAHMGLVSLDADGTRLDFDESFLGPEQSEINRIDRDADGRWWVASGKPIYPQAVLYRIDGAAVTEIDFPGYGFTDILVGATGPVFAQWEFMGGLDDNDAVAWTSPADVLHRSLVYGDADDTLWVLDDPADALPMARHFDFDGTELADPLEFPTEGRARLTVLDDMLVFSSEAGDTTTLHGYDNDLNELWSYETEGIEWWALAHDTHGIVAVGRIHDNPTPGTWWRPYLMRLSADGELTSMFEPDLAGIGLEGGIFQDLEVDADGAVYVGGYAADDLGGGAVDWHGYVVKMIP